MPKKFIVTTPVGIARFPHLDKPDTFVGKGAKASDAKPKFKLGMSFPKDTDMSALEAKIVEAIREEWGPKIKPAAVRSCLKDGDAANEKREAEGKEADEYIAGKLLLQANSAFKPAVVDAKKKALDPRLVRGGDGVRAIIQLMPCEPSGTKTIGVRLLAVQLVEKNNSGEGYASGFDEVDGFEGGADDAPGFDDAADKPAKKGTDASEDDDF